MSGKVVLTRKLAKTWFWFIFTLANKWYTNAKAYQMDLKFITQDVHCWTIWLCACAFQNSTWNSSAHLSDTFRYYCNFIQENKSEHFVNEILRKEAVLMMGLIWTAYSKYVQCYRTNPSGHLKKTNSKWWLDWLFSVCVYVFVWKRSKEAWLQWIQTHIQNENECCFVDAVTCSFPRSMHSNTKQSRTNLCISIWMLCYEIDWWWCIGYDMGAKIL